ncbi:MAG: DinB family protein [Chlorobiales bacterium]|nr:DinB family protein [Chlorobiales bacterium]
MATDLESLFGGSKKSGPKSLIDAYSKFPGKLDLAVEKLTESKLKWKPNPKQFSIREMICHLVDMESVAVANMNVMIAAPAEHPPTLLEFDTMTLAERYSYNSQDEQLAMLSLKYARRYMTEILKSLPETLFEKSGTDAKGKRLTVSEVLSEHNKHADKHLKEIERLKEEFKGHD